MNPHLAECQTPGAAHPGETRLLAKRLELSAQHHLFIAPPNAPSGAGAESAARLAMRRLDTHQLIIPSRGIRSERIAQLIGRQRIGWRRIRSRKIGARR